MPNTFHHFFKSDRKVWLSLVLAGWLGLTGTSLAQLAITEIMSCASTYLGTNWVSPNADWWEITNFGTNEMDLTGYKFCDTCLFPNYSESNCFDGVWIGPNESIIMLREGAGTVDADAFRAWWGIANPNLQIITYVNGIGFSSSGEYVQFGDNQGRLIDRVAFPEAVCGTTFTYETNCGKFGELSELGSGGTRRAVTTDDIGSPGVTSGPVPLAISRPPTDQTNAPGGTVQFTVEACGLPQARFQWRFEGNNLVDGAKIQGSMTAKLELAGISTSDAGAYTVVINNGLTCITSSVARLRVDTETLLEIVSPPKNLVITSNQTATFTVIAMGNPQPLFQWSCNGTPIPGATRSTLAIPGAGYSAAGLYCVQVENGRAATNLCASLTVTNKPRLMLTECLPLPCVNQGVPGIGDDWWELTSLESYPVNLRGYRWDDGPGVIGQGGTVTNDLIIRPGESVIFARAISRADFIHWWGERNLPSGIQVVTFTANGLNEILDEVTVWNATATVNSDYVTTLAYANASAGVTFWFGGVPFCSEFGVLSSPGLCGAFTAQHDGDVGSPGWTPWTPPYPESIICTNDRVRLTWKASPGTTNLLQMTRSLALPDWTTLGANHSPDVLRTAEDDSLSPTTPRFYRVVSQPNCHKCDGSAAPYADVASEVIAWPPPPLLAVNQEGRDTWLSWSSVPGLTNVIQYRDQLWNPTWTALHTNKSTNALDILRINPAASPQRFYRLLRNLNP